MMETSHPEIVRVETARDEALESLDSRMERARAALLSSKREGVERLDTSAEQDLIGEALDAALESILTHASALLERHVVAEFGARRERLDDHHQNHLSAMARLARHGEDALATRQREDVGALERSHAEIARDTSEYSQRTRHALEAQGASALRELDELTARHGARVEDTCQRALREITSTGEIACASIASRALEVDRDLDTRADRAEEALARATEESLEAIRGARERGDDALQARTESLDGELVGHGKSLQGELTHAFARLEAALSRKASEVEHTVEESGDQARARLTSAHTEALERLGAHGERLHDEVLERGDALANAMLREALPIKLEELGAHTRGLRGQLDQTLSRCATRLTEACDTHRAELHELSREHISRVDDLNRGLLESLDDAYAESLESVSDKLEESAEALGDACVEMVESLSTRARTLAGEELARGEAMVQRFRQSGERAFEEIDARLTSSLERLSEREEAIQVQLIETARQRAESLRRQVGALMDGLRELSESTLAQVARATRSQAENLDAEYERAMRLLYGRITQAHDIASRAIAQGIHDIDDAILRAGDKITDASMQAFEAIQKSYDRSMEQLAKTAREQMSELLDEYHDASGILIDAAGEYVRVEPLEHPEEIRAVRVGDLPAEITCDKIEDSVDRWREDHSEMTPVEPDDYGESWDALRESVLERLPEVKVRLTPEALVDEVQQTIEDEILRRMRARFGPVVDEVKAAAERVEKVHDYLDRSVEDFGQTFQTTCDEIASPDFDHARHWEDFLDRRRLDVDETSKDIVESNF